MSAHKLPASSRIPPSRPVASTWVAECLAIHYPRLPPRCSWLLVLSSYQSILTAILAYTREQYQHYNTAAIGSSRNKAGEDRTSKARGFRGARQTCTCT
ncbi:hypothetical protein AOQ84DRAFT_16601 [Glonium stellatum]|uniref:Uncharacterized protein n=1 Tax=Glonium stellatum TaxID=574774 RepID=A0A8E2F3I1_9PEZI|nr:hypothetical protein AOQ84DRAFT_16601 [Glonium stellatum]